VHFMNMAVAGTAGSVARVDGGGNGSSTHEYNCYILRAWHRACDALCCVQAATLQYFDSSWCNSEVCR